MDTGETRCGSSSGNAHCQYETAEFLQYYEQNIRNPSKDTLKKNQGYSVQQKIQLLHRGPTSQEQLISFSVFLHTESRKCLFNLADCSMVASGAKGGHPFQGLLAIARPFSQNIKVQHFILRSLLLLCHLLLHLHMGQFFSLANTNMGPSSVPRTHTGQLTTAYHVSSMESNALLQPPQVPRHLWTNRHNATHIIKEKNGSSKIPFS